jgi:hypothetical protein
VILSLIKVMDRDGESFLILESTFQAHVGRSGTSRFVLSPCGWAIWHFQAKLRLLFPLVFKFQSFHLFPLSILLLVSSLLVYEVFFKILLVSTVFVVKQSSSRSLCLLQTPKLLG